MLRKLRRRFEVRSLLVLDRELVKVYKCRGIDIDIVKFSFDGLSYQAFYIVHLRLGILEEIFSYDLEMVSLDEDRSFIPFPHRCGKDDGRVFERPLLRIPDFGPGDLENNRADLQFEGLPEYDPRNFIREAPYIDRRHRKAWVVPTHLFVEFLNGCRYGSSRLRNLLDENEERFS